MKVTQMRTVENVHMGADLTKSILSGDQPSAKQRGLRMETHELGVKLELNGKTAIVPFSNIIVFHVEDKKEA